MDPALLCMHAYVLMCVCLCLCVCACVCADVCVRMRLCMHVCIRVYTCVTVCTCVHAYVCAVVTCPLVNLHVSGLTLNPQSNPFLCNNKAASRWPELKILRRFNM